MKSGYKLRYKELPGDMTWSKERKTVRVLLMLQIHNLF